MAIISAPRAFRLPTTSFLAKVYSAVTSPFRSAFEQIVEREMLRELRGLDEHMLRDIGASDHEIYRVQQMRRRERLIIG